MTFTSKDWRNLPDTSTPISAEALEDMETRLSAYTDLRTPAAAVALEQFAGADPTGSTPSDAAFAAALATGAPVDLGGRGKTWKITGTVSLPSGANIIGNGATIDASSVSSTMIMLQALGTLGTGVALTLDATKASFTVTVGSTTGIAAGDYIHLNSALFFGDNPRGEILRVRSVTSTVITFYHPLCDNYNIADGAQVQKITSQPSDIRVRGVRFLGPTNETIQITGLHLELCRNVRVEACDFEHTNYVGTAVWNTIDFTVRDCHYRDNMLSGFAYGVSIGWAAADGVIEGCLGERMRHLVTHGGGSSRRGIVRRIKIIGNTGRCTDAAFDSHASSDGLIIANNTIYNSNEDTAGTTHDGIISQGANTIIVNNLVYGVTRTGIFLQSLTLEADTSYLVSGNYVERAVNYGISAQVVSGGAPIKGLTITDNVVKSSGIRGIWIDAAVAAFHDVNVSDNIIRSSGTDGLRINNVSFFIVANNHISGIIGGNRAISIVTCTDGIVKDNMCRADVASGSDCIVVTGSTNIDVSHNRCPTGDVGVSFDNLCSNCAMSFNDAATCTNPYLSGTGAGHIITGNRGQTSIGNTASAATITLGGREGDIYKISGTTNIDTITATGMAGRRVILIFLAALTVGDSTGNLKLNGNFVTTADDTLSLVCDGTSWYETARAVN